MTFSFSFTGDDIEDDGTTQIPVAPPASTTKSTLTSTAGAFPVQGKPLLPPTYHSLDDILSCQPSKIAFSLLDVTLPDGRTLQLPRRELWDVRVQLMAEEDGDNPNAEAEAGLGQHDVKTGIYEGGFKSWESSVDLVKVLASGGLEEGLLAREPCILIELGCGTALPSLALFQWALAGKAKSEQQQPLVLTLADYNPTVLYLVTLPNMLLSWALQRKEDPVIRKAFTPDGELELIPEVIEAFKQTLINNRITLSFLSGGWSPEFVDLLYSPAVGFSQLPDSTKTLVLGSETIYSPFALENFSTTLLSILENERRDRPNGKAKALVAAKRLYFGVGGSLDDFIEKMRGFGTSVSTVFEETQGVSRGVVECLLP